MFLQDSWHFNISLSHNTFRCKQIALLDLSTQVNMCMRLSWIVVETNPAGCTVQYSVSKHWFSMLSYRI